MRNILLTAQEYFKDYLVEGEIHIINEHNQYWVKFFDTSEDTTRTFSVIEAKGIGSINGLDFEEV